MCCCFFVEFLSFCFHFFRNRRINDFFLGMIYVLCLVGAHRRNICLFVCCCFCLFVCLFIIVVVAVVVLSFSR